MADTSETGAKRVVFVSQHSGDRRWVKGFFNRLEECVDPRIKIYCDWKNEPHVDPLGCLQRELEDAVIVLVVVSPGAMASRWVVKEIHTKLKKTGPDVPIWPLTLHPAPLPPLVECRPFDLISDWSNEFPRLVREIHAALDLRAPRRRLEEVEEPEHDDAYLEAGLRNAIVELAEPRCNGGRARRLERKFGMDANELDLHASAALAVSAALHRASEDRTPVEGAVRFLDALVEASFFEGESAEMRELCGLRAQLGESGDAATPSSTTLSGFRFSASCR